MDRDGTIIKELPYISEPEKVELLQGAVSAIKLFRAKGFKVIIITNQSGVGRGYFSLRTLKMVNQRLFNLLKHNGTCVDKLYFCTHKPEDNCECRKPKTGMIEQAKKEFDISLKDSYIIGDKLEDIELGKAAGIRTVLVMTGHGKETGKKVTPNFVAKDLIEAANWICSQS